MNLKITMKYLHLFLLLPLLLLSQHSLADPVDFELTGLDGKQHRLSDYRGKWVLVNFWATWCPPCLEEMPELELFHSNHKDNDAVVLGLNMEDIPTEKLTKFVEQQFVSYPILLIRGRFNEPFGRVPALPTSFLVSPDGEVAAKQVGTVTAKSIERFMKNYSEKNQ